MTKEITYHANSLDEMVTDLAKEIENGWHIQSISHSTYHNSPWEKCCVEVTINLTNHEYLY